MGRVFVVGSCNMDVVVQCEQLPVAGETITGTHYLTMPGGKGANQAIAASRLGAEVFMIGSVGHDSYGTSLKQSLNAASVNTRHLTAVSETSGTAFVLVGRDGANQIVIIPGANAELTTEMIRHAFMQSSLKAEDVVLGQFESPLESVEFAFAYAKNVGSKTILNPSPFRSVPARVLANTDILIVNQHEAAQLAEMTTSQSDDWSQLASQLFGEGPSTLIVTMGESGVWVQTYGTPPITLPAYRVKVVDTTGAGDAFAGGFAAELSLSSSILSAIDTGNAAAALTVESLGAQSSILNRDQIRQLQAEK